MEIQILDETMIELESLETVVAPLSKGGAAAIIGGYAVLAAAFFVLC